MATILNTAYLAEYDKNNSYLNNIQFGCLLVDEFYDPNPNDTLQYVRDSGSVILDAPVALIGEVINKEGMSELMERMRKRLKAYANQTPSPMGNTVVIEEKYKEALNTNDMMKLRESGAAYIVVYDPSLNIICFTESIQ